MNPEDRTRRKIFLIGDSIRYGTWDKSSPGYGIYVKEKLKDRADVFAPDDNCRFAQYTLRYLHEWARALDGGAVDTVHWNNGLWDVARICGDEPLTPVDVYVGMLKRVYARIRQLFPQAKVIFATSTPVLEERAYTDFYRRNAEIQKYNERAKELMRSLDVEIDDLYAVAAAWDESAYTDWVHFNARACEALADAVIRSLG